MTELWSVCALGVMLSAWARGLAKSIRTNRRKVVR